MTGPVAMHIKEKVDKCREENGIRRLWRLYLSRPKMYTVTMRETNDAATVVVHWIGDINSVSKTMINLSTVSLVAFPVASTLNRGLVKVSKFFELSTVNCADFKRNMRWRRGSVKDQDFTQTSDHESLGWSNFLKKKHTDNTITLYFHNRVEPLWPIFSICIHVQEDDVLSPHDSIQSNV